MKTTLRIYIVILGVMFCTTIFAQTKGYQEITEKRIEYIAPRLNLTVTESEKFWPIFRQFHQEKQRLSQQSKLKDKHQGTKEPKSEDVYLDEINTMIDSKIDQANLMKTYNEKYLQVLPASKVYRLYQLDDEFNKFLLKQLKDSGGGRRR